MPSFEYLVYIIVGTLGLAFGFLSHLIGQERNRGRVWMWASVAVSLTSDLLVVVAVVKLLLVLVS